MLRTCSKHLQRSATCRRAVSKTNHVQTAAMIHTTSMDSVATTTHDMLHNATVVAASAVQQLKSTAVDSANTLADHVSPTTPPPSRSEKLPPHPCNNDPEVLKAVLNNIQPGLYDTLGQELAFCCVTHRTYRHAKEGYNSRLAFLGRRILTYHLANHLYAKDPFSCSPETLEELCDTSRLGNSTAIGLGLGDGILRWTPAYRNDLAMSAIDKVSGEALQALVGAVYSQKGSLAAKEFVENVVYPKLLQGKTA